MLVKVFWLRKQPCCFPQAPWASLVVPACLMRIQSVLCAPALHCTGLCRNHSPAFTKQRGLSTAGFLKKSSSIPLDCSLGWAASPSPREAGAGPHGAVAQPCTGQTSGLWKQHTWVLYPKKLFVLSCCTTAAAEPSCLCSLRAESTKEGISCLSPWKQKELNWDFFYMDTTDMC